MNANAAKTPKADDDDFEDDEEVLEVLPGHVQSAGDTSEVAGLLLELIGATSRVVVMVSEMDEDEFGSIRNRLSTYLELVQQIPVQPRPKRRIGFRSAKPKAKSKSRRK